MKELTKRWIADTVKKQMLKTPLNKVRISQICAEAGIDRSTFYYYFRDKYDVVAWIFYDSAFKTNILSKEEAAESLLRVKKDQIFYKRAFEDTSQNPLWEYMLEYYCERYAEIARGRLQTADLDARTLFAIRLYSYGTIAMSREWLLADDPVSAEEEVERMHDSMPEPLRKIFFP